jgi:outer membrane protein OmpA-like peptidoglycan-associated protein
MNYLESLEYEAFEGEPEWESEIDRRSALYLAWVQFSLNMLINAGLVVDGVSGPKTAAAVRSFQSQQGLTADGKTGPITESRLVAALNERFRTNPASFCAGLRNPEIVDKFDFNRYAVKPAMTPTLTKIAQCVVASQGTNRKVTGLRLVGHTDPSGTEAYNQALGSRRSRSVLVVLQGLVDRLSPGLAGRLSWNSESMGESQARFPTPAQNRRVEIFLATRGSSPSTSQAAQARQILEYIRREAKRRAGLPRTLKGTNFARVVASRYLRKYLDSPSAAMAAAAIKAISRQNTSGVVTKVCGVNDFWEAGTPGFNGTAIPVAIRAIPGLGWLPANFGAATDILRVANRRALSHIDGPFLIGRRTLDTLDCTTVFNRRADPDLQANNGINESQLMHWATGVRYAHLGRDRLRDLFLAYELWHLELWDVFGHDPINDLIAEEAARYMANQIRSLRMKRSNYIATLDSGFHQARAWVGALLRLRQRELDRQILADPPPSSYEHWTREIPPSSPNHPFKAPSIRRMLHEGRSLDSIKRTQLVKDYAAVYTLIFEATNWEQRFGPIPVTLLQTSMATGRLNSVFRGITSLERGPMSLPISR